MRDACFGKWKTLALALNLCGMLGCQAGGNLFPQQEAGTIDIRTWEPDRDGMVNLDGRWAFYPLEFVEPHALDTSRRVPKDFLSVPGTWNQLVPAGQRVGAGSLGGSAFGTYHLRIRMPETGGIYGIRIKSALSAYKLWVDGQLVASAGEPGTRASTTIPLYAPKTALFESSGREISVVIHIANFHHRDGGLYRGIVIGTDQQMIALERRLSMTDMFVLASILVMAGYHLIHFFYRREEVTSLYFALGCISVLIWHASNNEHLLRDFLPAISSGVGQKIDSCSFFGSVAFFALFIHAMFREHYPKWLVVLIVVVCSLYSVAVLPLSMLAANQLIPSFQAFTALGSLVSILLLARAVTRHVPLAGYILVGVVVFLVTYLHDILYSHGWIQTTWLSPYGLVFFIFLTSMTITVRFKKSFNHINQLKSTFEKFVPKRFLLRITDEDLSEIELGHAHGESLVVLFSDIRGFTAISEQLGPADLLEYLNLYFLEMATVVKRNGGFIDKFIGDAVMALFDEDDSTDQPSASSRAFQAAVEMQSTLTELNSRLEKRNWPAIRIGIGMHYGPVVMGTVGAEFRMDSTVLGDTVNTAARLEGLTKQFESHIIVSSSLLAELPSNHQFSVKEIGTVPVQGKKLPVQIFELATTNL